MLKKCNFLFKVTQPFPSHSFCRHISPLSTPLSHTGCRAGPSFPLIKYVCLYLLFGISAVLHSRRVTYGKHGLPRNTALSRADFFVLCITHVSWTRRGITCDQAPSQKLKEFHFSVYFFSFFPSLNPHHLPQLCLSPL